MDKAEMSAMVVRLDQRMIEVEKDQASLHKDLYGNGRNGWIAEVRALKNLAKPVDLVKIRWRAISNIAIALTVIASFLMSRFS